ncbi:hypothetical protein BH23PSE1_BH23PSE1_14210 [soil metagenome]
MPAHGRELWKRPEPISRKSDELAAERGDHLRRIMKACTAARICVLRPAMPCRSRSRSIWRDSPSSPASRISAFVAAIAAGENCPRSNPMMRTGSAWEVAEACAYLGGPAAGYVTGEVLNVAGGAQLWGDTWTIDTPDYFRP